MPTSATCQTYFSGNQEHQPKPNNTILCKFRWQFNKERSKYQERETLKKESRVQFSSKCNQIKPNSEIKDNSNILKDDFSLKTYPSSFTLAVPELLQRSNEKKSSGIKICPTLSAPIHKVSMDIFHCRYHLKLWPPFRSKFKPRIVVYCIISINSTACLVFMHSRP